MTDHACLWKGPDKPRVLRDRHLPSCPNPDDCRGCEPCPDRHCTVCGREHAEGVCPGCLGEVRTNLATLDRLCSRLATEMVAKPKSPSVGALAGVPGGVSMFLAGPVADPEAYAHRATASLHRAHNAKPRSIAAGAADHLRDEHDSDDEPPLAMLIWWEDKWRDITGQLPGGQRTVSNAITFLETRLTWAAAHDPAFKDFHRDLKHQVARVEDALVDGERPETGAPCLACGTRQEKRWGTTVAADRWFCPRCKRMIMPGEYARSVANEARTYSDWLTATDMRDEYGIPVGSLSSWASGNTDGRRVRKRRDTNIGRMVYNVEDALARRDATRGDEADDTVA